MTRRAAVAFVLGEFVGDVLSMVALVVLLGVLFLGAAVLGGGL